MPKSPQSLVPYQSTPFTSTDGTTYKGKLDANTTVFAHPAGALYVYPSANPSLNVLVDRAYNFTIAGPGGGLGTLPGPVGVLLTVPVSNSWYATVYFDSMTGGCAAINGSSSGAPTPILPKAAWQIPLAIVLLTAGQTSVTALNIQDVRSLQLFRPISISLGTIGTNTDVECFGATTVHIDLRLSASCAISLNHLLYGATVSIFVSSVGSFSFFLAALDTAGVSYGNVSLVNSAGAAVPGASGIPLTASAFSVMNGVTGSSSLVISHGV
jgi:hypothetical protein